MTRERDNMAFASLARRADLPPRVRGLLDGLLKRTIAHFEIALPRTLDDIERDLFKLAERSRSNAEQQKHFENLREIKLGRADVAPRFLEHVESRLALLRAAPGDPARATTGAAPGPSVPFELVDTAVFEEDLALREMAGKSEIRNSLVLHALSRRFGVLAGSPAWPYESLPLGPAQFAAAFGYAMRRLDLDTAHRVLAYRQFDRTAMASIAPFYEDLNAWLVSQRVLPNLQIQFARRPTDAAQDAIARRVAQEPVSAQELADAAAAREADAGASGDPELFKTLRNLLSERRHDVPPDTPGRPAFHASSNDLQSVLGALQRSAVRASPAGAAAGTYDSEHFKNTLLVKLRRASPEGRPLDLAEEDSDTVDLVGMLFDYIARDVSDNAEARTLLTRLHVPVLRVALGDKTFFTRRSHPARELLNTIAETGAQWMGDDDADPALIRKMQLVVDHVSTDFDGNLGVFESMLDDLSRHMHLLARRAEVVERRHVDAAKGRDKLDVARASARGAIGRVIERGTPIPLVRSLLEQAWTDALALSALRQGEGSSEFKRRLAVAEKLARRPTLPSVASAEDAELRDELDTGLRQVGLHGDDVRDVLGGLFPPPGTGPLAAPELDRIDSALRSKTRLGGAEAESHAAPGPARAGAALNPKETEMLEQLRKMPFGTWFEFVTNQQGDAVRRKLAWYSTLTGRCLFVNQRGARTDDRQLEHLARDMVRGQVRLASREHVSLIDRAWKAITEALRTHAPPMDAEARA